GHALVLPGFDLIANDPCLSTVKMLQAKSHSMGSMASSTPDFLDFQRMWFDFYNPSYRIFISPSVNALKEEGVSFGSFDILSDQEVREGLKTYSNWPTYPQLYYKVELVGGCNIVLELKSNGELKSTLSE
ncbi:hypothetical protein Dimus_024375, partial [Dionaea muscipula]